MPASIYDPVSNALHLSLTADDKNQNELLDNRLISSAKSVLLTNIEFQESGTYQSDVLDGLKSKYIILKADKRLNEDKSLKKDSNSSTGARTKPENGLPMPKKVLFPLSSVRLGWESGWQVGSGMHNLGNTCYLNSTLQALFHVPAFANWLISESFHPDKCVHGCVICCMRKTLIDTQNSGSPIRPWQVYSKLRQICRHLTPGRQEDAHEFLRYLVESMEKTYLNSLGAAGRQLEPYSKESTPLNQILGGYLRSAVRCLACSHVSTTFQHFQDLLVDARKPNTLEEALNSFFACERLEDLGYKCQACNKKVSATKQFFIERAPMVLCIALKRFSITGGKVSKHIQFRSRVFLKKFMVSQGGQDSLAYRLVSVVTHLGPSQNCGHYTAVGLGPGGNFYQFDDNCVRAIPISNVLGTNAYIMFYELEKPDNMGKTKMNGQSAPIKSVTYPKKENEESLPEKKSSFIGPVMPENIRNKENSPLKLNGLHDINSKPNGYRPSENASSTASSSNEKPASKLVLNLQSSCQSQAGSSSSSSFTNGKISTSKITFSNDDSIRNTVSNVLSPSKSTNIIQNGSSQNHCEAKTSKETKAPLPNLQNRYNGHSQNSTTHTNGDVKFKNKFNGEENKYNHKPIPNGNSNVRGPLPASSNHSGQNGVKSESQNGNAKKLCGLVPYGLESGEENLDDEDEEDDCSVRNKLSAPKPQVLSKEEVIATKATDHGWKVSSDVPVAQHSPSLNGVVNIKLRRSSDACNEQPTVVSNVREPPKGVVSQLQRYSYQGYGAPISSWDGHHSQLNRQVFDDKKNQLKRSAEDDEMDRGRVKKVRSHNYNNGNKHCNEYNPFQDVQNQRHRWNDNGNKYNHFNKNGRTGHRGRFVHNYSRHHSGRNNYHHHNHYGRNR